MKNTLSYGSKWGIGLLTAALVLTILAVGAPASAEDAPSIRVNVSESVILTADNVDKVAVADPAIANVVVLSDKELSIIGIKVGVTTLTIVHKENQPAMPTKQYRIEVFNQSATASFDATTSTIRQMTGQQSITVRTLGDTLVLDGQVDDEIQMLRATQVAGASSAKVLNLLEVKNPRQIKIRTRVVEVTSDSVKRLGVKFFGANGDVNYGFGRVSISEGAGGDFAGAIIYLFAHQLVTLDRLKQVRMIPGRTGRQLVRSVADRELKRCVEPTLRLFEAVYYGHVPPSPAAFEAAWAWGERFEQILPTGAPR